MSTTNWPTIEAFHAGQEYVHSVSVRDVDSACHDLAASFAIALTREGYVLTGFFTTAQPGDVGPVAYLPHASHVREVYATYSRAKRMAAFFRQKSRYCGQVLAARKNA